MRKSTLVLISVLSLYFVGCGEKSSDSCSEGDVQCTDGIYYTCDAENSHYSWKATAICYNRKCAVGNDQSCEKKAGCSYGNNVDGSCINTTCDNGNLGNQEDGSCIKIECDNDDMGNAADGSCLCPQKCNGSCNTNGSCRREKTCNNGYDENGDCFCPAICNGHCDAHGSCVCPDDCKNGCDDTYTTCCEDNCAYGCDSTGACKCSPDCKYGCVTGKGNTDLCCKNACIYGCSGTTNDDVKCINATNCTKEKDENDNSKWDGTYNDDGSCGNDSCIDKNNINADGSCGCNTAYCIYGCKNDGSCKVAQTCKDKGCEDSLTYCVEDKNSDYFGTCILEDANGNHMLDRFEELDKNKKDCRTDSECGSGGFCDSYIGYNCSTRCTDSNQCVDGFVCRADGRCASKYFTTVWSPELRKKLYAKDDSQISMKLGTTQQNCDDIKICWDWIEGKTCEFEKVTCVYDEEFTVRQDSKKSTPYYVIEKTYDDDDPNEGKELVIKIDGELDGFTVYRETTDCSPTANKDDPNYEKNQCRMFIKNNGKSEKREENYTYDLIEVRSFGLVGLDQYAFVNCHSLASIPSVDIPDSTKLQSMNRMFKDNCSLTIQDDRLNKWDVSSVTNMFGALRMDDCGEKYPPHFNASIENWNVSAVKDMRFMFYQSKIFTKDLSGWDVSNVTSADNMFVNSGVANDNDNACKIIKAWNERNSNVFKLEDLNTLFGKDKVSCSE